MQGYRALLFFCFLLLFAELFLSFVSPLILSVTIDSVLGDQALSAPGYFSWFVIMVGGVRVIKKNLWIMALALVALQAARSFLQFVRPYLNAIAAEGIAKRLRDQYYVHTQNLPFKYHASAQTGDLIQRATNDIDTIRRFYTGVLLEFVRTILLIIVGLFVMLNLNIPLTIVSFVLAPIIVAISLIFFKKIQSHADELEKSEGKVFNVIQENLTGTRVVRAFGRQSFELDKFNEGNDDLRRKIIGLNAMFAKLWSSLDAICGVQIALVSIFGIIFTVRGDLSVGQYTAFYSYVFLFLWPIRSFGRVLSNFGRALISVSRVESVLNEPQEDENEEGFEPVLKGDIVFKDVDFSYEESKVLNGLNMTIPGGGTVAILGGTGSGKSTIALLLQRLYDIDGGSIYIGSAEISQIKKSHLRNKIGIVLQEPFLYSKTIEANIGIKLENPDSAAVREAAAVASIHEDIESFEHGYKTVVGERGVTLSGGQKQRVAIARTLLCDSDILIFDDSLSAVDTMTDARIRESLKEWRGGVTTIIISHRITTLMEADKIFVLQNGQVTESGSHQELMAINGIYRRTYEIQSATAQ